MRAARDPWHALRRLTQARIGLGRAGVGLPTSALLEFQLDHACARDAVWSPWDVASFASVLQSAPTAVAQDGRPREVLVVQSQVRDRSEYLKAPHLGRRLDGASRASLAARVAPVSDVVVVVSNGLSSTAIERHGANLVEEVWTRLVDLGLSLGPIVLVPNGRVAIGDDVGEALGARLVVVLIGERPGLSSADGIGIYLTFAPAVGTTDERRNCISNVRCPGGLGYAAAAAKLAWLVDQALHRQLSGVALKDEAPVLPEPPAKGPGLHDARARGMPRST